ncbi:MAG: YicC/YloC family endoribonuclease [Bacillota bacterium]
MLNSMTGYGRGSSSQEGFTVTIELRSVNHRYADFSLRMPRELHFLEDQIRRTLQETIKRGRVEGSITLDEIPAGLRQVKVNYDLAESYYYSLQELCRQLDIDDNIKMEHLMQMPELLKTGSIALTEEQVWPVISAALWEAREQLVEQRRAEGENLCRDLLERCTRLEEQVDFATERAEEARDECRRRLEQKFAELLTGEFEESRLMMEIGIQVERMGIDEELVRLKSHLDSFRANLRGSELAGRKLDFIAQEIFREVNTIGSKAGDYPLTNIVVEMKAELEKIREQVQNLE